MLGKVNAKTEKPVKRTVCKACKGEGTVLVEVVTKKVKGQAGDASFLREFRENMTAAAKLKGLFPKERAMPPLQLNADNLYIHGGIDYTKADPKTILKFKTGAARSG